MTKPLIQNSGLISGLIDPVLLEDTRMDGRQ